MKNGSPYFKYTVILIVVVVILLLFRRCGDGGGTIIKNDTVTVRDTQWIPSKTDTQYVAKPYKVTKHDTLEIEGEPLMAYYPLDEYPPIVKKVFEDYNSTKYYADSFDVNFGKLYLYDTTRAGKLRKGFSLNQDIPVVTESTTITVHEKKRVVLYAGVTGIGNQTTPIYAVGGKLGIMAKNGKYYGGSYLLTKSGAVMYQADILIPIRLRKK